MIWGLAEPYPLDIPERDMEMLHKKHFYSLTPEEENSLEEFAWVFGTDAVKEIEKQVKYIVEQIHGISDLEKLSEAGLEEKLDFWHSLGPLDEDELLRRLELHIDDLPPQVREKKPSCAGPYRKKAAAPPGQTFKRASPCTGTPGTEAGDPGAAASKSRILKGCAGSTAWKRILISKKKSENFIKSRTGFFSPYSGSCSFWTYTCI